MSVYVNKNIYALIHGSFLHCHVWLRSRCAFNVGFTVQTWASKHLGTSHQDHPMVDQPHKRMFWKSGVAMNFHHTFTCFCLFVSFFRKQNQKQVSVNWFDRFDATSIARCQILFLAVKTSLEEFWDCRSNKETPTSLQDNLYKSKAASKWLATKCGNRLSIVCLHQGQIFYDVVYHHGFRFLPFFQKCFGDIFYSQTKSLVCWGFALLKLCTNVVTCIRAFVHVPIWLGSCHWICWDSQTPQIAKHLTFPNIHLLRYLSFFDPKKQGWER